MKHVEAGRHVSSPCFVYPRFRTCPMLSFNTRRLIQKGCLMIKVLAPANINPSRRTMPEFHNYWAVSHGPLFSNTKALRRYVQHLSLPEAYNFEPKPTFDGASMFWYDDVSV